MKIKITFFKIVRDEVLNRERGFDTGFSLVSPTKVKVRKSLDLWHSKEKVGFKFEKINFFFLF